MLKVGLTGGIATGKSHVLALLREFGCETSDADTLAHQAMSPGNPAFEDIVREFGTEVLAPDGTIDRARLGQIVFADAERRQQLNSIVHPRVFEAQAKWYADVAARRPDAIAVVDAALMIETGSHRRFDVVVVVHCAPELQIERLMTRNRLTREEALARINAQMPSAEKLRFADYTIDTSRDFADTRRQVEALYATLEEKRESGNENS